MRKIIIFMLLTAGIIGTAAATKKPEAKKKPKIVPMAIKNSGFQQVDEKGDPQKGTWWKSWHVHNKSKPEWVKLQREGYKYIIQATEKVNPKDKKDNDLCAKIVTPLTINQFRDAKGEPMISNGFAQTVKIKGGGDYTLSLKLKGKLYQAPGFNNFVVVADFLGGNDKPWKCKKIGDSFTRSIVLPAEWKEISVPVKVPEGADFMCLYLKIYGCGEAFYDNISLAKN